MTVGPLARQRGAGRRGSGSKATTAELSSSSEIETGKAGPRHTILLDERLPLVKAQLRNVAVTGKGGHARDRR
jgi:hypothetical protein